MAVEKLDEQAITEALASLPDWQRDGDHIRAEFKFPDFKAAFAFMTEMADEAERLNHHPEWSNVYSRVTVGLTTHDVDGLSSYDMEMAASMSAAAARHS